MKNKRGKNSGPELLDSGGTCFMNRTTRTISLIGEIETRMATKFRRFMQKLEVLNAAEPIVVEITTDGGEEIAGGLIIDTIQNSPCQVLTIGVGNVYSMGILILVAGDRAISLPSTRFMVHEGETFGLRGNEDQLESDMKEVRRWGKRVWDYLDKKTKQKKGYWKARCKGIDLYLDAKEAVASGLVSRVITRDL